MLDFVKFFKKTQKARMLSVFKIKQRINTTVFSVGFTMLFYSRANLYSKYLKTILNKHTKTASCFINSAAYFIINCVFKGEIQMIIISCIKNI